MAESAVGIPLEGRRSTIVGGQEVGLFSVKEWDEIKKRSRQILRGSKDRVQCLIREQRRAKEFEAILPGEIPLNPGMESRI